MATQTVVEPAECLPTVLDFSPFRLSEEQFDSLALNHPDLDIELTADGELVILAPTGTDTGWRNADLIYFLSAWARSNKAGKVFDSSSMFTFGNGAKRFPDVAWISRERWDTLPESERRKFAHIAPDFVAELRSETDPLNVLRSKMEEYTANGVRLGWLIDPLEKRVHIYRADGSVSVLDDPESVSGEDVLPGFELPVRELW